MDDPGPEDGDFLMPDHFKGIDLSDDMMADLDKLLAQFSECLSDKPGHTHLGTHSIQTTTELPIWSPSYTIPANVEAQFKQELDNLLADGIIEESDSSWSSPPIPVRKKDGSIRIVVDYRKLTSVTIYNPFYHCLKVLVLLN